MPASYSIDINKLFSEVGQLYLYNRLLQDEVISYKQEIDSLRKKLAEKSGE